MEAAISTNRLRMPSTKSSKTSQKPYVHKPYVHKPYVHKPHRQVIYGKEKLWLVYLADQRRWVAFDGPDTVDDTVPDVGNWIFSSVENVREPGDHVWSITRGSSRETRPRGFGDIAEGSSPETRPWGDNGMFSWGVGF